MHTDKNELDQLFDAYLTGELDDVQKKALLNLLETPEIAERIEAVMMRSDNGEGVQIDPGIKSEIDAWLQARVNQPRVRRMGWLSYAAAVVVLLGLAGTMWLYFSPKPFNERSITERYKNDIRPKQDKAILKLPDGREITIDQNAQGVINTGGSGQVEQANGVLTYDGTATVSYHDIITPAGGKIELKLADGTLVWLDAQSSIHFPTAFPGKVREVEVTGQAYFEVAKDASRPFVVSIKGEKIQVLGTHFNVNSFEGDQRVRTTLLEGSVKVSSKEKELILKPGQQSDGLSLNPDVDLLETMAWKDGKFKFSGATIEEIMSQLARWYGAKIVYKEKINEEFVATINRTVPVSEVLKLLEETGQVHFEIDGETISVYR
ncbi:MAG: hypothetical protein DI535_08020 [Citrobacter freundii]|nr:MAG: hypothetical protein DI535_08020 [Citrobacter freundii]